MSDTRAARFLRIFSTLTFGALLLTLVAILFVDPLGMFGMPTYEGFNAKKTQYYKYLRMAKPHTVRVLQPSGLILGTSRAEYLDPAHPGWNADARPVYNMAIVSSRMHEVLRNLQHAQAQHRLRQVVLLLDDFMFDSDIQTESGFDEARLDVAPGPRINTAWLGDMVRSLLSFDTLFESIDTIRMQGEPAPNLYLTNGMRDPYAYQIVIDRAEGHRNVFLSMIKPPETADRLGKANVNKPYEDFRTLLMFCRAKGIDLRLVISPVHAYRLEFYWRIFGRKAFDNWIRRMVQIVSEEATQAHSAQPYPIWDFSGFNSITLENIPPKGDANTRMEWYWEGSHFKTKTGHLMFDRIFGYSSNELSAHPDFGVRIDTDNIEQHLQSIRAQHLLYMQTHQHDVQEMSDILQHALQNESISAKRQ